MVQEINNKATNCTEVKFMQKIFIYRTSPNGWIFPNIAAELTSDTSTLSLLLKLYRTSFNLKKNYMHLEALKYSRILHPVNQDSFSVIICTENFEMELNKIRPSVLCLISGRQSLKSQLIGKLYLLIITCIQMDEILDNHRDVYWLVRLVSGTCNYQQTTDEWSEVLYRCGQYHSDAFLNLLYGLMYFPLCLDLIHLGEYSFEYGTKEQFGYRAVPLWNIVQFVPWIYW